MEHSYLSAEFQEYFDQFAKSLSSHTTRKRYYSNCEHISSLAKKDFLALTQADAVFWLEHLQSLSLKPKTIAAKVSSLSSISRYLIEKKCLSNNLFLNLSVEQPDTYLKLSDIPSLSDLDRLLSAVEKDSVLFCILSLVIRVGLTASEAVRIRRDEIALFENGTAQLTIKKGQYARSVMLPRDIVEVLSKRLAGNDYIFYNSYGNPLRLNNLHVNLVKAQKAAGLDTIWTLQEIRHAALLLMLKGGAAQEEVAVHAGVDGRWMFRYNKIIDRYPVVLADYQHIRIV